MSNKKRTNTLRITWYSNHGTTDVTRKEGNRGSHARRERSKRTGRTGRAVEQSQNGK